MACFTPTNHVESELDPAFDVDIKPIAKSEEHYQKWVESYPFYANVNRDGVTLYAA